MNRLTADKIKDIRAMYNSGASINVIKEKLGISAWSIYSNVNVLRNCDRDLNNLVLPKHLKKRINSEMETCIK